MLDKIDAWIERSDIAAAIRTGLVMLTVATLLGMVAYCTGCSSPIQAAARGGTLVTSIHLSAGEQIDAARGRALDAVPPGPEHDSGLDAEAARWEPVGVALDAMREALRTYAQTVTLAFAAGNDGALLPEIARLLARLVGLYAAIVQAAEDLGVDDLPALPAEVRTLADALGGE